MLHLNQLQDYVFLVLEFLRIYEVNKVLHHQPIYIQNKFIRKKNEKIRTHFSVFSSKSHLDILVNSATFSCGKNWQRLSTWIWSFFINSLIYLNNKLQWKSFRKNKIFTAASVVCFPLSVHLLALCVWSVRLIIQFDPFSPLNLCKKKISISD